LSRVQELANLQRCIGLRRTIPSSARLLLRPPERPSQRPAAARCLVSFRPDAGTLIPNPVPNFRDFGIGTPPTKTIPQRTEIGAASMEEMVRTPATGVEVSSAFARVTTRSGVVVVGALLAAPSAVGAGFIPPDSVGAAAASVSGTRDCPARVMGVEEVKTRTRTIIAARLRIVTSGTFITLLPCGHLFIAGYFWPEDKTCLTTASCALLPKEHPHELHRNSNCPLISS